MKTFWLLPNAFSSETPTDTWVTPKLKQVVDQLTGIVGEDEKSTRLFLKSVKTDRQLQTYPIRLLNEHSDAKALDELVKEISAGGEWGLISDQGLPSVADPGESLVERLIKRGIRIRALGAGSSIIHALLVTGFPAERFTFLGYLPKEDPDLLQALKKIEKECAAGMTQLAIERPYANVRLIQRATQSLPDQMTMAVVLDIGSEQEEVLIHRIQEWKKIPELERLNKRPAIFLFKAP